MNPKKKNNNEAKHAEYAVSFLFERKKNLYIIRMSKRLIFDLYFYISAHRDEKKKKLNYTQVRMHSKFSSLNSQSLKSKSFYFDFTFKWHRVKKKYPWQRNTHAISKKWYSSSNATTYSYIFNAIDHFLPWKWKKKLATKNHLVDAFIILFDFSPALHRFKLCYHKRFDGWIRFFLFSFLCMHFGLISIGDMNTMNTKCEHSIIRYVNVCRFPFAWYFC